MTDHQFVVCQNDYPICVLPAGATHEQARAVCDRFQASYIEEREKQIGGIVEALAAARHRYFHFHEVPVEAIS
jgi:hypothetical protein